MIHLRRTPDTSGTSVGTIVVQAMPGHGLCASYRPAATEPATEFAPDLFDAECGAAPDRSAAAPDGAAMR